MCLGGGGGDGGAAEARAAEQKRQREIEQAYKLIERTFAPFEGREQVLDTNAYNQAQQRYQRMANPPQQSTSSAVGPNQVDYSGMTPAQLQIAGVQGGSPGGFQGTASAGGGNIVTALPDGTLITRNGQRISPPNKSQFRTWQETGDNLYDQAQQDYLEYYQPQLDDQFKDYQEQSVFDLANRGLLASSAAGDQSADLQDQYQRMLDNIRSKANEFSNTLRGNVVDAKSNLRALAQSGASPSAVQQQAIERARTLGELPAFDPLGDVFGQVAAQTANRRAAAGQGFEKRMPSLIFSGAGSRNSGNVRTVG